MGLLEAVADAGFSLLVGPRDARWEPARFAALTARSGVYYAGLVPAEAVPSYLACIDVGITPYRDSEFNRASFPLKTLEYLSAGRPVVATDLPSARWLRHQSCELLGERSVRGTLELADDYVSFVEAVRRMASANHYADCIEVAAQHSWRSRADKLAGAIGLQTTEGDQSVVSSTGQQT